MSWPAGLMVLRRGSLEVGVRGETVSVGGETVFVGGETVFVGVRLCL